MTLKQSYATKAFGVLALATAGLVPLGAQAQTAGDGLKWEASIYGWFPAIGGSSSFPVSSGGSSIDVSARQVIDALKMTFMGSIGVKERNWGFWTDLVYADFGATKDGTRDLSLGHVELPASVTANLSLDIKSTIWTLAGTYSLASTPQYTADLVFGARMLQMDQTLGWTFNGDISGLPLPSRTGSAKLDVTDWDGIVGVKGNLALGGDGKWFVPYYFDVGTGQSDLTWQANVGIGYRFGWGAVVAGWRYLDYQFKSGEPIQSMSFNGATVGVTFQW